MVCEPEPVRFAFISSLEEENVRMPRDERVPVSLACEVLGVSRSGYYAWKKRQASTRTQKDAELTELIVAIHAEHEGRYGIDRIHGELARRGHRHSPRRVRRPARAAGLECVHPRPYKATTVQDRANQRGLVDLVGRRFVPDAQDQLWFGDITYIHTMTGWVYLATVIDGYSRKVIGWAVADHMREDLVCDAMTMAIRNRRPAKGEVIMHTDRGSQYTGSKFRDLCLSNGIIPSVGATGSCFDNAAAESWHATFKKELIHLHVWSGIKKVTRAVFEYIEVYYNRRRIQKRLSYLTPHEYELGFDIGMVQAA
ncbi:MAG: IS3 family transposase [Actinoallomurus sp.]